MAKSKAEQADIHASRATDLFADAHDSLANAVQLYSEAEAFHSQEADTHAAAAAAAAENKARSERIRTRIADLLS